MNLDHSLKTESHDHYICTLMNAHEVTVVHQSRFLCISVISLKCW